MEVYNSWKDSLFPAHIKKILKGDKKSPNVLSAKKYAEAQQMLKEMSIGDFVLSSEDYMYTNYHESLREQIFNSLNEDLKKDISFIMRLMGCSGVGYIDEESLGEYYPFVKNKSIMPRGLDVFYKFFPIDGVSVDEYKEINKKVIDSIKAFLIYNNFEKTEDKRFLIDFISSENINKNGLFLSSLVGIFNENSFPEKEYKEKINQKILFEISKMNLEQINSVSMEVHSHIYYQMSKNEDEKSFINKNLVLAVLDRWKNLIIKSGKTELGDNIYFMNIVEKSMKNFELKLSREHMERFIILDEANKKNVKITVNSNLVCAGIKMSMQTTIDERRNNMPIYLNINGLYSTLVKVFKDNEKTFKDMFSVEEVSLEKKNPDANIVGTLTVKIEKGINALDEAKRVQEYILNCMSLLFDNLSISTNFTSLEDGCINFLEKAILKQDLDILKTEEFPVKRKVLKF